MSDTTATPFAVSAPLWALSVAAEAGYLYSDVSNFKITPKTLTFTSPEGSPVKLFRRNAFAGRS
jgi:hypothetical protein